MLKPNVTGTTWLKPLSETFISVYTEVPGLILKTNVLAGIDRKKWK
jgi:hypothetical protein